jgi:hypothetical protein
MYKLNSHSASVRQANNDVGRISSNSSTTYPAEEPSETVTNTPSSPSSSTFVTRIVIPHLCEHASGTIIRTESLVFDKLPQTLGHSLCISREATSKSAFILSMIRPVAGFVASALRQVTSYPYDAKLQCLQDGRRSSSWTSLPTRPLPQAVPPTPLPMRKVRPAFLSVWIGDKPRWGVHLRNGVSLTLH